MAEKKAETKAGSLAYSKVASTADETVVQSVVLWAVQKADYLAESWAARMVALRVERMAGRWASLELSMVDLLVGSKVVHSAF